MSQELLAALFAAGGLTALAMALVVLRRRGVPGAIPFTLLMCGIAWWEIASALEALAVGIPAKIFWSQMQYVGIATVPTLWFCFAVEYAGKTQWLTRRVLLLLTIVPLLVVVSAFTNEWHAQLWTSFTPGSGGPQDSVTYGHGILFWLNAAYAYGMLLGGTILFARTVIRSRELYRLQAAAMLTAVLIPWLANALYIFGVISLRGVDFTPLALTATGVLWVLSLYGFRLFDIVPVARDVLVEGLSDGVIVLDARNRIVDVNAAALELLGKKGLALIGQPAREALQALPGWTRHLEKASQADAEIALGAHADRFLHLRLSPLLDRRGVQRGRLLLLQDITARKHVEHELQTANAQLQSQLTEIQALQRSLREQAIRDPLTGLYNRRFLRERLTQEIARCAREGAPLCLIMLDIDHFKSFNDAFGHHAGDMMLTTLSHWLDRQTREGDLICRYGGEEFVVLLPDTPLSVALRRAQEWRLGFREQRVAYQELFLSTTISLGVALFPQDGATPDALLRAADVALYAAKAAGRDCVCPVPVEPPTETLAGAALIDPR